MCVCVCVCVCVCELVSIQCDRNVTQLIFASVWMALTEFTQLDQQQDVYNLDYTSTEPAQGTSSSNGLAPVVFQQ